MLCNRQVKLTRSIMVMLHRWLGIRGWSTIIVNIYKIEMTVLTFIFLGCKVFFEDISISDVLCNVLVLLKLLFQLFFLLCRGKKADSIKKAWWELLIWFFNVQLSGSVRYISNANLYNNVIIWWRHETV